MIVIFKDIPKLSSRWQLERLIRANLTGGLFSKSGTLKQLKILQNEDLKCHAQEYHAIAWVDPDVAAERLIKRLNGKSHLGTLLQVSEYTIRHWDNDRRLRLNSDVSRPDKRLCDRRRKGLELALYHHRD